ncbi:Hypothetical predicted protein [Olea europaea subsp. europaea]|uniref:DUF1985 domain-containing protein n=1 Tax=Olea europaea subsp. europaea TaxID=158383 RepID=A0A8S0T1S4_OLEEU|nr:Hypothetical predicted protein [Olea europaea subsp. europaea]
MEKILQVDATITTRCRLQILGDVYEKLDTNYKNKLSESCFGSLLRLKDIKLASQFKIGEKNAKFGLEEFILVTGLNAGDDNDVDKTLGEKCRIVKEYFKNSGGKITKGDAYNAFVNCKKRKSNKYKLGLIVILAYVLWAMEENTYIDLWWLDLVDDLDRFKTYPWEKFSFEYTISIFKREMGDKLKSSDVEGESRCRYSLHGFPLAIMLEVNSTLIPTETELEEAYWKELKPIVEKDESVSHHSERDEAEQDAESQHAYHEESPRAAQPPKRGFEINIEDLLRTKIEKLEGRLQAVISTRLDRVEKKVDYAFDGATSSTAYVLENEPKVGLEKKVGFDDVTDVHAAERKELETEPGFDDVRYVPTAETNVEAREEDPKLEEEVRGKNVGGKGLEKEAGSGNDIDEQENEKMIKESVGKEIILEEEHPDVEKEIADFVTPEKHDVDINEFMQDM